MGKTVTFSHVISPGWVGQLVGALTCTQSRLWVQSTVRARAGGNQSSFPLTSISLPLFPSLPKNQWTYPGVRIKICFYTIKIQVYPQSLDRKIAFQPIINSSCSQSRKIFLQQPTRWPCTEPAIKRAKDTTRQICRRWLITWVGGL